MGWAELSIQNNREFIKQLGVLTLPTIQFYIAGALSETFACGPSKFQLLKRKLANLINENIDAKTYQLKASTLAMAATLQRQQEEKQLAANMELENNHTPPARSLQSWQEAYEKGLTKQSNPQVRYNDMSKNGEIKRDNVPYTVRERSWDNSDVFGEKRLPWLRPDLQYARGGYV